MFNSFWDSISGLFESVYKFKVSLEIIVILNSELMGTCRSNRLFTSIFPAAQGNSS